MKGSPIVSTIAIILVLLGMYAGVRYILPKDQPAIDPHADHGHKHGPNGEHLGPEDYLDHGDNSDHNHTSDHDDSALETAFEIACSTKPKSIKISQPDTKKVIFETNEIDGLEHLTAATISLNGHSVELAVEIQWEEPGKMNFAQISISPANHATKQATLKSETHIDDIAEFHW